MRQTTSDVADSVPRWLMLVLSVGIGAHLVAILFGALTAPSGPWPSMEGMNMATPPQFAFSVNQYTGEYYLKPLHLTHNYHFPSNQPGQPEIYLDVTLRDEAGEVVKTVRIPDRNASFPVRYRQTMLAQGLGNDQPVMAPQSEVVAPVGQSVPKVQYWDMAKPQQMVIKETDMNLLPRDRPVSQPSPQARILAQAYTRYLCRVHGAAKAEIVRHHKNTIPPAAMFMDTIQGGMFDEAISNFGEFSR